MESAVTENKLSISFTKFKKNNFWYVGFGGIPMCSGRELSSNITKTYSDFVDRLNYELSDFQHILKHRLLSDPFDNRELQELYQKLSETTKIEEVPIPQSLRKQPSPFADIATTKTERKTDWEEYKKIWSVIKEEWLFAYPFYKYHIEKKMIYINFTFKTEEKLTYNIVQPIS